MSNHHKIHYPPQIVFTPLFVTTSLLPTTRPSTYLQHTATHEWYVPPIYATSKPTFTTPVTVRMPYEIDQYVEMEKEARSKEDESLSEQLWVVRKQMKNLQVAWGGESLDYMDLCIHPDVDMSARYKPLKFDFFDGIGNPHAHLRAYCNKLVGVERNEKLRIKLFIRILTREALTYYTRQDPSN